MIVDKTKHYKTVELNDFADRSAHIIHVYIHFDSITVSAQTASYSTQKHQAQNFQDGLNQCGVRIMVRSVQGFLTCTGTFNHFSGCSHHLSAMAISSPGVVMRHKLAV